VWPQRHLALTLETCVRLMEPAQEQWVWILDMAGYTRANSPPIGVSLTTLRILADHCEGSRGRVLFTTAVGLCVQCLCRLSMWTPMLSE
jgi:hypothetical protein